MVQNTLKYHEIWLNNSLFKKKNQKTRKHKKKKKVKEIGNVNNFHLGSNKDLMGFGV